jgi:hypothetical protein
MRGALSDERTILSFTITVGLASAVILGSESRGTRDYIAVSYSRLPFPSPPTTRRATVEVFDPTSTRDPGVSKLNCLNITILQGIENTVSSNTPIVVCLPISCLETVFFLLLGACSFPREPVYQAVT